jgi:hypothetical protein
MTGRADVARVSGSLLRTDEHVETAPVTRGIELADALEAKSLHGAEGTRVEGRDSDAKCLGRELCPTEGQARGNGMPPEALSNQLGAQSSAGVECLVVVVPTRYLSVGTERAKADQLAARQQGMEPGLWLQQPVGVCLGHVVAVVGRSITPSANVECVLSPQRGDLHRWHGPGSQRVVCWSRIHAHGLQRSAETRQVRRQELPLFV